MVTIFMHLCSLGACRKKPTDILTSLQLKIYHYIFLLSVSVDHGLQCKVAIFSYFRQRSIDRRSPMFCTPLPPTIYRRFSPHFRRSCVAVNGHNYQAHSLDAHRQTFTDEFRGFTNDISSANLQRIFNFDMLRFLVTIFKLFINVQQLSIDGFLVTNALYPS